MDIPSTLLAHNVTYFSSSFLSGSSGKLELIVNVNIAFTSGGMDAFNNLNQF